MPDLMAGLYFFLNLCVIELIHDERGESTERGDTHFMEERRPGQRDRLKRSYRRFTYYLQLKKLRRKQRKRKPFVLISS